MMDRLTKKYAGGYGLVNVKDNEQSVESPHPNTLREILKSIKKLGAYEDTGLTPEEINHLLEANRTVAEERDAYGKGIESLQAQLTDTTTQLTKCHMRELTAISEVCGVGTCYGCKYAVDQEPCYCADCDLPEGSCYNCTWSGDPCGFCTRGDAMPSDKDNWVWHAAQAGEVKQGERA